MLNANCKDCAERYPGCHDHCEKYKEFKEKLEKQRQIIAEAKSLENFYVGFISDQSERRRRRRHG